MKIRNPFRNKATITIGEAARRLGVSQRTIYRWFYKGRKLHGVRSGITSGVWRVEEDGVIKLERGER